MSRTCWTLMLGVTALAGCVRYLEAPAPDPLRALREPVLLEAMSRIETRDGRETVRFRFTIRSPRDSAIVLALAPDASKRLRTLDRVHPVIEIIPPSSLSIMRAAPIPLVLRSEGGGAADSSLIQVGAAHADTTITVLADVSSRPAGRFDLRVNWYRLAQPAGQRGLLDFSQQASLESRERPADVTSVSMPLTLALAVGAIIGFFLATAK